ncbi:MAG: hypothetical protein JW819_01615 [Candidatus Krumholzibacteriota bacterium]|nr:hypothetical protein [Candidatus Krumholzibacteriota bacterium]
MRLRSRILLLSLLLVLAPMALLYVGLRVGVGRRLAEQYEDRVAALADFVEADLGARGLRVAGALETLAETVADDTRLRLAILDGDEAHRGYLIDHAGRAMRLTGLDMLQLQDADGRILSSGHFRNAYDRVEPLLPARLLTDSRAAVLGWARRPEGRFLVLLRARPFTLGGRSFVLTGGVEVDRAFLADLARGSGMAVSLVHAGGALSSDPMLEARLVRLVADDAAPVSAGGATGSGAGAGDAATALAAGHLVRERALSLLPPGGAGDPEPARLLVSVPRAPLTGTLRSLDLWLALVLAATAAGAVALSVWISRAVSRPLADLAAGIEGLDLESPAPGLATDRADEVGEVGRFLDRMLERLRATARDLREAERRATLGELSRQVHHDIRNGVTPLRNVLRHLAQVAADDPAALAGVFAERRRTLESGLAYLEELAGNYARLAVKPARGPVDLGPLLRALPAPGAGVDFHLDVPADLPPVLAETTGLRRIVENLLRNAVESLPDGRGRVSLSAAAAEEDGAPVVRLVVADTGGGIPPEIQARVFDDFYTTKAAGSGLGLSIVRRLASDFGGRIAVDSAPGAGSRFTVTLPAARDKERP